MKEGSILSRLQAYAEGKQELNLEALREQAEEKCKPGTFELTEDAVQEARDHCFDPKRYANIIISLRNSSYQRLLPNIMVQYNTGVIDLERLFRENSAVSLASIYPHYKNHISAKRLLLVNPTMDDSRTTFIHELFSNSCPKEDIIHFFKELNILAGLNPKLISSYLALSDTDGKSIRQLLEEKSLTESYRGIAGVIKASCRFLYPINPLNVVNIAHDIEAVGTHTASIHSSVDKSFVKLASIYDSNSILSSTGREVRVDRNAKWLRSIEADFKELEERLRAITENDQSITKFITPTLAPGEDQEYSHKKFKFQAETALRMIDGLKAGGYGNHLIVLANENLSCGLTPKEIVAIAYASLKDVDSWNNPEQKQQHFIQFIESLYISKRGYNIDLHGAEEWNIPSPEEDKNKCTGGAINEIAAGLRDHLHVEVKVITTETMEPILLTKLADTLGALASSPKHKDMIDNWLSTGTINASLAELILTKLKEDEEFSQEFSKDEIEKIGSRVLNKLQKDKLDEIQESLQNNFPEIFSAITRSSESLLDKGLTYSFIFKDDRGYVLYLESLYHTNRDRFNAALQCKLNVDITDDLYSNDAKKTNLMLSLLLVSQDAEVVRAAKEMFQAHVEEFNQEQKNQYLILMAEKRNFPLLTVLIDIGADINACDNRLGHGGGVALHEAVRSGRIDVINKLVELGADINARDRLGRTALIQAVRLSHDSITLDIIDKLVELGADINARDRLGRTALLEAAMTSHHSIMLDIIVKLTDLGADINDKDNNNLSALHLASGGGTITGISGLLNLGADITVKDSKGFTVLDKTCNVDEVIDAIIENKSVIPVVINHLIKKASGYIQDEEYEWRLVKKIVEKLSQTDRLEILSAALKEIDNTSRRDRLLSFIPEEERNLVRAKVSPTMWESVREAAELIHGNTSVDIPKRPMSYAKIISEETKNKVPSRF